MVPPEQGRETCMRAALPRGYKDPMDQRAPEDRDLSKRRVLITGGSSGIGLACARVLENRGATVGLIARGEPALAEAANSLGSFTSTAPADVTDVEELRGAFASVAGELGGLDAVVANAGAGGYGPFIEMKPEDYRRTVEVTLLGALNTAHIALPYLQQTHGTLVIVGSVAGRVAAPWLSAYAAAKYGVRGFARSLRTELRALRVPVEVALVAPGPVDTPFWRRARTTDGRRPPKLAGVHTAEDVAAGVVRALQRPRPERTIGALMASWVFLDAVTPNLTLRLTVPLARFGWRNREDRERSGPDAFEQATTRSEMGGGLRSRPSVLRKIRDWSGVGR